MATSKSENQVERAVRRLIAGGAHCYVSMSGGKDSLAIYALVREYAPDDQITVIHANLGEIEWPGIIEHIEANIEHPLEIVSAVFKDGTPKTLFEMVRRRHAKYPQKPCWPSAQYRTCTSDLKVGPIDKFIKADMKRRGITKALNITGLRAEESDKRAKRPELELCDRFTAPTLDREVWNWLPIKHWPTARVFSYAAEKGMKQHPAYETGNERLSCQFCIMGCDGDLQNAARQNPELLQKYIELEEETGYTMLPTGPLAEKLVAKPASGGPMDWDYDQGELFA